MPGNCVLGLGVDCRYFVMGVLDELYNVRDPMPARLPPETATFNLPLAMDSVHQIADRYPCIIRRKGDVEPGDVIVSRRLGEKTVLSTPAHVMVYTGGGVCWHATKQAGGVIATGLGAWIDGRVRIYRPQSTDGWSAKEGWKPNAISP